VTIALAVLAVLLLVGGFVAFIVAKRNAEKAEKRRSALALEVECQAREDERRAARDASRRVIFSPLDVERAFTDEVKPLFPTDAERAKTLFDALNDIGVKLSRFSPCPTKPCLHRPTCDEITALAGDAARALVGTRCGDEVAPLAAEAMPVPAPKRSHHKKRKVRK
jgi:hypothetical protein